MIVTKIVHNAASILETAKAIEKIEYERDLLLKAVEAALGEFDADYVPCGDDDECRIVTDFGSVDVLLRTVLGVVKSGGLELPSEQIAAAQKETAAMREELAACRRRMKEESDWAEAYRNSWVEAKARIARMSRMAATGTSTYGEVDAMAAELAELRAYRDRVKAALNEVRS